ncbi:hypothetical protein ACFX15_002900 [Malus domestica]
MSQSSPLTFVITALEAKLLEISLAMSMSQPLYYPSPLTTLKSFSNTTTSNPLFFAARAKPSPPIPPLATRILRFFFCWVGAGALVEELLNLMVLRGSDRAVMGVCNCEIHKIKVELVVGKTSGERLIILWEAVDELGEAEVSVDWRVGFVASKRSNLFEKNSSKSQAAETDGVADELLSSSAKLFEIAAHQIDDIRFSHHLQVALFFFFLVAAEA